MRLCELQQNHTLRHYSRTIFTIAFCLFCRDITEELGDLNVLDDLLPLVKKSLNGLIAGEGQSIAELFDLTEWAGGLPAGGSTSLSELKNLIRAAFQGGFEKLSPDLNEPPSVPDPSIFNVTRPENYICADNDKAISIDIDDTGDYVSVTFCTLLEFDEGGSFDGGGLLDAVDDFIDVDVDGNFLLKGALVFGANVTVEKGNLANIEVNFDPIGLQLSLDSGLDATISFGLIKAIGDGDVSFGGAYDLAYCSSCGDYGDGFERVGDTSFFSKGFFAYDFSAGLGISTSLAGLEIATGEHCSTYLVCTSVCLTNNNSSLFPK